MKPSQSITPPSQLPPPIPARQSLSKANTSAASTPAVTTPPSFSSSSSPFLIPFQPPDYFDFPPFFTIQPNLTTRHQQIKLWCDLILSYVKVLSSLSSSSASSSFANASHSLFNSSSTDAHASARTLTIFVSQDTPTPIFSNKKINRKKFQEHSVSHCSGMVVYVVIVVVTVVVGTLSLAGIKLVCEELLKQEYAVPIASSWTSSSPPSASSPSSATLSSSSLVSIAVSHRRIEDWAHLLYNWATDNGMTLVTLYEIQRGIASKNEGKFFHPCFSLFFVAAVAIPYLD